MQTLKSTPELTLLARKYIWWESPEWAMKHPDVFLANIMNLGAGEDMMLIYHIINKKLLVNALKNAAGYFSYRSWDYWHLKLGFKKIPPLPKRSFK